LESTTTGQKAFRISDFILHPSSFTLNSLMALQDLTPQLRTRLSRLERAVGWFVMLATLLLAAGFFYYLYHTAKRKGWFLTKAPYYTYTDNAVGLKVGDPVKLMGFDAGRITSIAPMPPGDVYHVYVAFEINAPNYGYLWTDGSRVKISPAGLLGQREMEVTKGREEGRPCYATYLSFPLREVALTEALGLPDLTKWHLAAEIYDMQTNLVYKARTPLSKEVLDHLARLGLTKALLLDTREQRQSLTAVWNDDTHAYEAFIQTNPYFMMPEETPALTERLERMLAKAEAALPRFLALAAPLSQTATNASSLTSNLNFTILSAQPAISNLTCLTEQLRGRGQLGEWLLPTNLHNELEVTLTNVNETIVTAHAALASADTNLTAVLQSLVKSLDELSGITSNLHAQVRANTNILSSMSDAIVHADGLMQGLKRHWLLRSAFKEKPLASTNAPPRNLRSPKDASTR
jgi:ABC-type transporter Mla subunit MlaD